MDWDAVKDVIRGPAALQMPPFNDDLSLNVEELKKVIRRRTMLVFAGERASSSALAVPASHEPDADEHARW